MLQLAPMGTNKLDKVLAQARIGAHMVRDGHVRQGVRFFAEEFLVNTGLRALGSVPLGPRRVACNVCGWTGARFLTHCAVEYVNRNAFCPRCLSYPRHRAFAHWAAEDPDLAERMRRHPDAPALVFAPEPGMMEFLGGVRRRLVGFDLERRNAWVGVRGDGARLPFADGSLGFVFCFHVLEHIEDDLGAMREIARCLRPGACLVLSVPIEFHLEQTVAYGRAHPLLNGHWYGYGRDFGERAAAAGLQGRSLTASTAMGAVQLRRRAIREERLYVLEAGPGGVREG